jgi:hydrogenase maturation protease
MSISRSDRASGRTVVIGLGNTLMGDDGLGIAALERLQRDWSVPPEVEVVDGGTAGMCLLPIIEGTARVLLIDAIDVRAAAGTKIVIERHRLPRYLATKISPHQIDLRDVLALAELRGTLPLEAVAIGLQPSVIAMSTELSAAVRGALDDLVSDVVRLLAAWGHRCVPKDVDASIASRSLIGRSIEETA